MKVVVTGGSGFVGRRVVEELVARGHQVVAPTRKPVFWPDVAVPPIGDLGPGTDWTAALRGCDAVVHCAARAHVLDDRSADPLAVFRHINRDGTLRLAQQAKDAGIGRFVFVSTIKVNGETTPADHPFTADAPPNPQDAYGLAKAEAEAGLRDIGFPVLSILRPPLVHGPGAKGNLAVLMKAIRLGLPLPLACVDNRRSMVGLHNLADSLAFLVERGVAGTYLVRDDNDLSTAQLIRALAHAMGKGAPLLPMPPALLSLAARLLGRKAVADRVLGSLVVDDNPLRALGWRPVLSTEAGLARMVEE